MYFDNLAPGALLLELVPDEIVDFLPLLTRVKELVTSCMRSWRFRGGCWWVPANFILRWPALIFIPARLLLFWPY